METFTLPRSGQPPLTFEGTLLTHSDGLHVGGKDNSRWHDLSIYRTKAGALVLCLHYTTCWQGEVGHDETAVCADPSCIIDALTHYDPCAYLVGYPPGKQYEDKQARLKADLIMRFAAQVSDVLADPLFAENLE
jgi:hypothetical protein